jgi:hypothetical protein
LNERHLGEYALRAAQSFNGRYLLKPMRGHVTAKGELVGTFDRNVPRVPHAHAD